MKKKNTVYIFILFVWGILSFFGIYSFIKNIEDTNALQNKLVFVVLVINIVFIIYFWLNGTKDIVYTVFYYVSKNKKRLNIENKILEIPLEHQYQKSKVFLLYCTCNDFIKESLIESMQQTHKNTKVVILDDSTDEEYKKQIDLFAKEYRVKVIRRKDNEGFKAGNLNHFLNKQNKNTYDYFVILDSDEIIPPDFVEKSLHYFAYYSKLGILQATHISTRNKTKFMDRFSIGVDSHWPTYQTVKERYGFLSLLGHGAMISRECFEATDGFPHVVAEDISFTIEAKIQGYEVGFSNKIICQEEYPVDYYAFKKRHLKWTGGNLEFIKKYTAKILKTKKMTWFEKLDIFLFTYSLPLSSVFFLFLSINLILLPALGVGAGYPLWLMVPTTIFLLAPMINDFIFLTGKIPIGQYIQYFLSTFLLFGSLYWLSFYGASQAWLGKKPQFLVTPKKEKQYTLKEIILGNIQEICFSITLISVSIFFTQSLLPVILIVIPSLSGIYLTTLSKKIEIKEKKTSKVVLVTSKNT